MQASATGNPAGGEDGDRRSANHGIVRPPISRTQTVLLTSQN